MKKARDLMQRNLIFVAPQTSLMEVRDVFTRNRVTGVPVISEEGDLLGVISQTDLVRRVLQNDSSDFLAEDPFLGGADLGFLSAKDLESKLRSYTAGDVMDVNVFSVSEDDDAKHLAKLMRQHRIHRLIVRSGTKPVGIVSALDLLSVVEELA